MSRRPISGTRMLITGASQGIGEALVDAYRELGYAVVANSRSIKPSEDVGVLTVQGDIGDPAPADVEQSGKDGPAFLPLECPPNLLKPARVRHAEVAHTRAGREQRRG